MMIEAEGGFYDIYDLKRPLTDRQSIVRGDKTRRRFISAIIEGAAQLAYYEDYFQYEANQAYARSLYGISIKEPRLVLVVGNMENVNVEEVDEAKRMFRNFDIVSYDEALIRFVEGIEALVDRPTN